jgi:hypothetical protein
LVSAPMQSNNFLDTDQKSQLYMGSLDSNDSYRPFPSMNQKRVVAGVTGTEYVLLPCVIMCVPHNVPGGVCCTFDVLYCCWAPVFEVT